MCSLQKVFGKNDRFFDLLEASAEEARAIEADYALVMRGLGTCARNRRPR